MMANRKLWQILAALWFVAWGLLQVSNLQIQFAPVLLGFLALFVAIFLFLDR